MNKYQVLALPIAVLVWITMNMLFIQYGRDAYQQLEERHLDIAVNYAVDAAVDELILNTANLDMDYADFERLSVEPNVALETFCILMMKNYGMSLSQENYTLVKSEYLPVFVVAAYDGYYLAETTRINSSGAHDSIFSIKQPYLYQDGSNLYALNLGLTDARRYDGRSLMRVTAPISRAEQRHIINDNVSDALMTTVYKKKDASVFSTIYIPSAMTAITRTNPIENVTVMAYVSGIDIGYGNQLECFGIGGARVTHEQFVGCYIKNGEKYYAYIKNIPNTIHIIETLENPMLAAQKGYYFDAEYN